MGRLTQQLIQIFRHYQRWEFSSQIGFVMAIVLAIVAAIVSRTQDDLRGPATIGAMGALITAQLIFMWANRGMVTPYSRAQQHYLRGEFIQAVDMLKTLRGTDDEDFKALTLLGNTYRQLGQLDQSEAVLYEAINIKPDHYFPFYGFGRTLLSKGCYVDSIEAIEQAINFDAPLAIRFDLGEAFYRAGQFDEAKATLLRAQDNLEGEPHRILMTAYLLHQLGEPQRFSPTLIEAGLPYWQAQAELFADTPYGQALQRDITQLSLMREES